MKIAMKLLALRAFVDRKMKDRPAAKEDAEFFNTLIDIVDELSMDVQELKGNSDAFIDHRNGGPSSIV